MTATIAIARETIRNSATDRNAAFSLFTATSPASCEHDTSKPLKPLSRDLEAGLGGDNAARNRFGAARARQFSAASANRGRVLLCSRDLPIYLTVTAQLLH